MRMRVMTYNVRNCRGTDGRCSPERIAEVIAAHDCDVVALQELDRGRARTGRQDQAQRIADCLGMFACFHPALRLGEGEYGDAILSRTPLRVIRAGLLPGVPRPWIDETRGALWVTTSIDGREVHLMNTHLGLGRAERRAQAEALLGPGWIGAAPPGAPLIVCGDLNSFPGRRVHGMFTAKLRDAQTATGLATHLRTFSTALPFACLDYIFLSEEWTVESMQVPRTALTRAASDHFPLVAELRWQTCGAMAGETVG